MNEKNNGGQQQNAGTKEKGLTVYNVAGQDVRLSFDIVRKFLVKGNPDVVSDQDLVQFISICKFNQLNPFLNEAYLVKYASKSGDGNTQMIVSKEALMKRADACANYDGIQAGIICIHDGDVKEYEGCFCPEGDKLVGGWAKVYRSDRKFPFVARVNLAEYNKGKSLWTEKPSTMIAKIAKVQALREAFPAQLGAMYTQEEQNVVYVDAEDVTNQVNKEKAKHANKTRIGFDPSSGNDTNGTAMVDTETGEILNDAPQPQSGESGSLFQPTF